MANVFVNRVPVGVLAREEPANRFTYASRVTPSQAVSLLMPIGPGPYYAERAAVLHPIFDMSLPEGTLREALGNMFAKVLPVFDDLALLEVVGRSLIGRLRFGVSAAELDEVPAQNLSDLLAYRGTGDLFRDLLERYARYSGVSGVQPKLLLRDNGSLRVDECSPIEGERIMTHGTTHLLKAFEAARYPALAANEYHCLQAARTAGLSVPPVQISADGRMLVIERFDRKADGSYLAFEDGCALDGRLSREKYEGSYEQLVPTLASALQDPDAIQSGLAQFFRSLVFSIAVRNGDAHRKNFGVLYDDATGPVSLAPTYDVATTVVYVPKDSLALTLEGSKRWPEYGKLQRFGVQRCRLTAAAAQAIIAEVVDAVATAADRLDAKAIPGSAETVEQMRRVWREGVASLRKAATSS
ncbi:MAG: type II toxin-antitoxin system HipA family toxin [Bryobacterales bacterium]|nr:type II toxin-antitoxin system HipA family toxin [Opitutaceae bacterium]MCZ2153148.1 type II toxin-antitoxin system HipA family toxin [Bryobacterales bacterium]